MRGAFENFDRHIISGKAGRGKQSLLDSQLSFLEAGEKEYWVTLSRTGSQELIQGQAWRKGQPLPHLTCPCGSAELPLTVEAPYDARVQLQTDQSTFKIYF